MKREIIIPPSPAPLPEPETLDAAAILDSLLDGSCDLVCVLGPTASGKTRYAVSLARRFDSLLAERGVRAADGSPARTEIISADSRQVYRGMSIGTGKDLSEYEEVPYHLIDIAEAGEKYDIYRYQHDFSRVYEDIRRRGCIALMCGGSGLYIEAATCGYNLPDVPADPQLRAELEQYDDATLTARLAALKPLHNSTDCDSRKHQVCKRLIVKGLNEVYAVNAAKLLINHRPDTRIAMNREYYLNVGKIIKNSLDCLVNMAHRLTEIFPAVSRYRNNAATCKIYILKLFILKGKIMIYRMVKSINNRIAGDKNLVPGNILLQEILLGGRSRSKMQISNRTGKMTIHLLRERRILILSS